MSRSHDCIKVIKHVALVPDETPDRGYAKNAKSKKMVWGWANHLDHNGSLYAMAFWHTGSKLEYARERYENIAAKDNGIGEWWERTEALTDPCSWTAAPTPSPIYIQQEPLFYHGVYTGCLTPPCRPYQRPWIWSVRIRLECTVWMGKVPPHKVRTRHLMRQ